MSIRNRITEKIVLPISDFVLGQSVSKDLKFLLKSQWWSKEQLIEYQNEKLRALIKHAYENTGYHKEILDNLGLKPKDIQSVNDLHKLPIMTKDTVRENVNNGKLIAKNINKREMILNGSSGSTGEPLQYFITKDAYSFNIAANLRGWYWMGYRLGDKYVKLSQNPRQGIKKLQDKMNNCYYLFAQQLNDNNFSEIVKEIIRIKPKFMRGYPDPMFFLAKYIKKNKIVLPPIITINTTGNILFPEARNIIEDVFNCRVFDSYSCEAGANVFECSTHQGYHSSMEYAITEIVSKGNSVNKGDKGRLITTDLFNYAVPFIRYDTQDYITKSKKCSCGRNLLEIDKIDGRDSDILQTPKGKYLILHNFTGYFEWINSVIQFQVRQDKIDNFLFLLKVNEKYSQDTEKEILKYWTEYINEDVKIIINIVNDIPLTKSGKRRFLIRSKEIILK
jgi:phenylacetate-CoA ligase